MPICLFLCFEFTYCLSFVNNFYPCVLTIQFIAYFELKYDGSEKSIIFTTKEYTSCISPKNMGLIRSREKNI